MSTRASHKQTLLRQLEDAVLVLEARGFDENTIHGFVNCILKGFIVNGEFSETYLANASQVMQELELRERLAQGPQIQVVRS